MTRVLESLLVAFALKSSLESTVRNKTLTKRWEFLILDKTGKHPGHKHIRYNVSGVVCVTYIVSSLSMLVS
jgi:hypothetical protein